MHRLARTLNVRSRGRDQRPKVDPPLLHQLPRRVEIVDGAEHVVPDRDRIPLQYLKAHGVLEFTGSPSCAPKRCRQPTGGLDNQNLVVPVGGEHHDPSIRQRCGSEDVPYEVRGISGGSQSPQDEFGFGVHRPEVRAAPDRSVVLHDLDASGIPDRDSNGLRLGGPRFGCGAITRENGQQRGPGDQAGAGAVGDDARGGAVGLGGQVGLPCPVSFVRNWHWSCRAANDPCDCGPVHPDVDLLWFGGHPCLCSRRRDGSPDRQFPADEGWRTIGPVPPSRTVGCWG